jgi:hypothetical protein
VHHFGGAEVTRQIARGILPLELLRLRLVLRKMLLMDDRCSGAKRMKSTLRCAAVAGAIALAGAGSLAITSSPAEAGWRTGTWRYYGGYGWGWRRHHGGAVAAGLIGGLVLGALAASAASAYPAYYAPYPAYAYPAYAPVTYTYAYPPYPYVYPRRVVRRIVYRPYPVFYRRPFVRRVVVHRPFYPAYGPYWRRRYWY